MSGLTIKISVFIHEKKYTYFVKKISASRLNNIRILFKKYTYLFLLHRNGF